jgi:hypothetical protein
VLIRSLTMWPLWEQQIHDFWFTPNSRKNFHLLKQYANVARGYNLHVYFEFSRNNIICKTEFSGMQGSSYIGQIVEETFPHKRYVHQ